MKTIVEALKDLYVAMGGESSDVAELSLNPDVIEKIAEVAEGGTGGGILIVNAEVQGGTGGFVVNSVDKKFSEIYNHMANGGVAVANALIKVPGAPYDTVYSIPLAVRATNGSSVDGTLFTSGNSNESPSTMAAIYAWEITFYENGTVLFKGFSKDFTTV